MATVNDVAHALRIAQLKHPSERAMQLVFNALDGVGKARMADGTPRDVFYVTNEELMQALYQYAKGERPSGHSGDSQ